MKPKKDNWFKRTWKDFKSFATKGNAFDLAVGVVIGGAFSAIVTAVVNILLSLCTWGIPGGLASLVTVLPANPTNAAQAGLDGVGQWFTASEFTEKARALGVASGIESADGQLTYGTNLLNSNYTKMGGKWVFNGAAVINWGSLINAIISFLIIAIILFIIVKVIAGVVARKKALDAKLLEHYYEKHPEERPVPEEPGKPAPTEVELLTEIRNLLAEKK